MRRLHYHKPFHNEYDHECLSEKGWSRQDKFIGYLILFESRHLDVVDVGLSHAGLVAA